jgi:cytochrome d ubiquinol oxidase subunit I
LLGILTTEAGWLVTEVGRQPWVIQGVMKTESGVSPGLSGFEATLTLAAFALVYAGILTVYSYAVVRIIRSGPPSAREVPREYPDVPTPTGVPGDD